jgi:hypothetical protein
MPQVFKIGSYWVYFWTILLVVIAKEEAIIKGKYIAE